MVTAEQRDLLAARATDLGPVGVRSALFSAVRGPVVVDAAVRARLGGDIIVVCDTSKRPPHGPALAALAALQPVTMQEATEVGAIESGQPRGLRDRSGALHQVHEIAALELRGRLSFRFGERLDRYVRRPGRAFTDRRVVATASLCEGLGDLAI